MESTTPKIINSKNYRPSSYSESYLDKIDYQIKKIDSSSALNNSDSNDLNYIELGENYSPKIKIITKEEKNPDSWWHFAYRRAISFIFHLFLISFFEILFFFTVIVSNENQALYNIADAYVSPIVGYCQNLNQTDRSIFINIFNYVVNATNINDYANQDYQTRKSYNNQITLLAWLYVIIIFCILTFLTVFNKYYLKIKINYKKILLDNFCMIILLGLYEYMFFNTVVIKYENIDSYILTQYVVNKIDSCNN